jgi:hypothetical protein
MCLVELGRIEGRAPETCQTKTIENAKQTLVTCLLENY